MTATVTPIPPILRIAYSDGEDEGLVNDEGSGRPFETRKRWEAEVTLFHVAEQYRGLIFWIVERGIDGA